MSDKPYTNISTLAGESILNVRIDPDSVHKHVETSPYLHLTIKRLESHDDTVRIDLTRVMDSLESKLTSNISHTYYTLNESTRILSEDLSKLNKINNERHDITYEWLGTIDKEVVEINEKLLEDRLTLQRWVIVLGSILVMETGYLVINGIMNIL
jgi:hypothetical protein